MEPCCLETFHFSARHVNGPFASGLVISMTCADKGLFFNSLLLGLTGHSIRSHRCGRSLRIVAGLEIDSEKHSNASFWHC